MRYWKWIVITVVLILVLVILIFLPQKKVLKIGDPVPDFRLRDLRGNDFFSNRYQGRVMLINFWATWCTYCREELPFLESFHQKYAVRGLQTVSILKDTHNIDLALEISAKNSISFPVLLDQDEELFQSFGVNSLPQTVMVDRRGNIRFIHLGFNPQDRPKLENEIIRLLEEK